MTCAGDHGGAGAVRVGISTDNAVSYGIKLCGETDRCAKSASKQPFLRLPQPRYLLTYRNICHILLRREDQLVVGHIVWCVAQPRESRRRVERTGHTCFNCNEGCSGHVMRLTT